MKQGLLAKITTLLHSAPLVQNLARKKFVARFVLGLFKSRNVQFCEVAQHLNDGAKLASNETRIQDFFREVDVDYLALAVLLVGLLPGTGKLRLCLDRTEWDFGQCQGNVLLVTVGRGDCHWPLCWELLDNRSGNSNAADRTALLDFCLRALGPGRVGLVVGDREFVGHTWFKYLKDKGIYFVMRLPKHQLLTDAQGRRHAVADWHLRPGQCRQLAACQVDGVWGGAQVTALAGGGVPVLVRHGQRHFFGSVVPQALDHRSLFSKPERPRLCLARDAFAVPPQAQKAYRSRKLGRRPVRERRPPAPRKSTTHQNEKSRLQTGQFQPPRP